MVISAFATRSTSVHAASAATDPLEGKWWGTAGTDKERIEVGFEFRRDDTGTLRMRFTQPITNVFDYPDTSEIVRDGDRVVVEPFALSLTLEGDTLSGTFPGPKSKALLTRVNSIPVESPIPDVPTGPAPLWQTRLGGQVFATPAVLDGVAYVGGTGGVFNAVDTVKGEIRWTFSAGAPIFGGAAVTSDAVFFASDNGYLYKLDRVNGQQVWRYALGDAEVPRILPHPTVFDWDWQAATPVVADEVIYVGSGEGSLHAIDATSGQRKWRFGTNGKIRNAVAVDAERVVFGSADHFVYALDRNSGVERWRYDTRADVNATPLIEDGRVYIGNRGAGLFALDANTGEEVWRLYFWGSWVESTPVISDGVLYVGSSDLRRVSAIDPSNGKVHWRSDVRGWTWGTPLLVGDRIYAGAAGGAPYFVKHQASLSTLDRETGKLLSRWPLADTGGHQWGIAGSPVRSGDHIIVATIEGSLFSFPLQ
ncbi:PQQ-binding-like beta-propeller repeat protein [Dokdonella sp.]|uniref:outer membrane protein assembly factor BamB family protein n=1 Tax=Dokdonella sp. TaxID=2291710 RepID=UPI003527CBF5